MPVCQLRFRLTESYRSGSSDGIKSPIAADFNGDNRTDVAFFDYGTFLMHIWLGNGNGTFGKNLTIYLGVFSGWCFLITVGDFNNDNRLDLVFTNENTVYVYIMFGNGDGTFQMPKEHAVGDDIYLKGIATSDFNNDGYLDVAVIDYWNNYLRVLLGNGNGSFSMQRSYYTGRNSYSFDIGVADFNGDGYQDIAVSNNYRRNIGVFLGHGDGTFEEQVPSFTGGYYYPYFFTIGDFNGDHRPDVAIAYDVQNAVGVLFGNGNGNLGNLAKYMVGNVGAFKRITVGDMNGDGRMDIVAGSTEPYSVSVLIQYGHGEFQVQTVLSIGLLGSYTWVDVADFNNDGCQDILTSDEVEGAVFIALNTCECRGTSSLPTSTLIHP